MLNVDLSMLLAALDVVTLGLFVGRLRSVEMQAAPMKRK
jgi:hypothetical protein